MTTLRKAAERAHTDGLIPRSVGPLSGRDLDARLQPNPRGSIRALTTSMLRNAESRPWSVILCRFKGEQPDPAREKPIEDFYRGVFASGTGGLVEYWRDASLGRIDVSRSKVFGWVEVDLPRSKANTGSGTTRSTLIDAAISAAQRNKLDPLSGFHRQIAVYSENWSINGVPPGLDWRDPKWGSFWIDGSADAQGRVCLTPPHDGNITAHEMGHGFDMEHDRAADLVSDYGDPCCIMSQNNPYFDRRWQANFGPAVCLPHLIQKGWMYSGRVYADEGGWMDQRDGISLPLAPIDRPGALANLGIKLSLRPRLDWDYYVEFVTPTDWNRGLANPGLKPPYLFIRRIKDDRPTYLALIEVPTVTGVPASVLEQRGNTWFEVTLTDLKGPVVAVRAQKL